MTPEQEKRLQKIEERAEATTDGRWHITLGSGNTTCTAICAETEDSDSPICDCLPSWILSIEERGQSERTDHRADMRFIAEAHSDIPWLIGRLREAEEKMDKCSFCNPRPWGYQNCGGSGGGK